MPSALRLNKQGLIDFIDNIEAGGGDASELRRELEELGPDPDSRTRTRRQGSRFNNEEEPTTADRLNHRVGNLFTNGLSDDLLDRIVELDRNHSLKELKAMCVEAGFNAGGDKPSALAVGVVTSLSSRGYSFPYGSSCQSSR